MLPVNMIYSEMDINCGTCNNNFSSIPIDKTWSFSEKTSKDTSYITHGYYTYPAKFIPQLAAKLIKNFSDIGDIVLDPFMGSGTTIVEAIVNQRIGVGVDINDIALLLAKAKTTPINRELLQREHGKLILDLKLTLNSNFEHALKMANATIHLPERVDYWFKKVNKEKLLIILNSITHIRNHDIRNLFLVVFAQILKTCSIWSQRSVKPTRDYNKKEYDPLIRFEQQSCLVLRKHNDFNRLIIDNNITNIDDYRTIRHADCRQLPSKDDEVSLVVTSPPYVTSYEYADLHQLPSLWFGYVREVHSFRKKFIGSSSRDREKKDTYSALADEIVEKLNNTKKDSEVRNYFVDMAESFLEMRRVLKPGGKAAIVIGNTNLRGVKILNAEVFKEQFENIGFKTSKIIHREIPSKMLPSTRDIKTGKFTKTSNSNGTLIYPTEYILIMEKL